MDLQKSRTYLLERLNWEINDKRVIDAVKLVPREMFVLPEHHAVAYDDRPLSIGFGQTISQPFIVCMMLQALELKGNEKVLEVGTGSGYVAALLSKLAKKVITVECINELVKSSNSLLMKLDYQNVEVHLAGDILGWPDEGPYDAIIVSAGSPSIPRSVSGQLSWGGRLVIPVGSRWEQRLLKMTRNIDGDDTEDLGGCYFVPLIGKEAWHK